MKDISGIPVEDYIFAVLVESILKDNHQVGLNINKPYWQINYAIDLFDLELDDIDYESLRNKALTGKDMPPTARINVNAIIGEVCVPLKRAKFLDAANKVYKVLSQRLDTADEFFMKSWAKIFVANGQLEEAYKIFEIGALQYVNGGGGDICECQLHMKDIEKARYNEEFRIRYINNCTGMVDNNTISLYKELQKDSDKYIDLMSVKLK